MIKKRYANWERNPKIKLGRPSSNKEPLSKYTLVYETIPEDGTPIRFIDIAKKLFPMSQQTISAALNFGCMIGTIAQNKISHKHVEYYKITDRTYSSVETTEQVIKEMADSGMSEMDQMTLYLSNLRPQARYDSLKKLKTMPDSELFNKAQAIFIKDSLSFIEEHILKALTEYTETPNKTAACDKYINTLQFIIMPLIKSLPKYVADVGMSEQVQLALRKNIGREHNLQESDFVDIEKVELEFNRTIDKIKNAKT